MPDLQAMRDDVALFAEGVLRRPLWPHQLEAAASDRFITSIAKARRTGGTTLVETLAAHACFRERNVKAVILSASQEASRRVTEDLGALLATSDVARGSVVDDFVTRIRLSNGSEIVSLPASQRAVRGLGRGVKLLVVDEAGFVPEELWRAAHYIALDERANGSRILLVGTPWGGPDAFFRRAFEAGRDGDPDHASHHWTFEVNPNLDRAYLERQRERVSPPEYAAEVLGEWSDAVGALIPRALIDANTADVEIPSLGALTPPARPIIGLDWGVSYDRSAAAVGYRLPVGELNVDLERRPRFIVVPFVWPAGHPLIGDERRPGVVHEVARACAPWGSSRLRRRASAPARRRSCCGVCAVARGTGRGTSSRRRARRRRPATARSSGCLSVGSSCCRATRTCCASSPGCASSRASAASCASRPRARSRMTTSPMR
jgi:hypothetical protein